MPDGEIWRGKKFLGFVDVILIMVIKTPTGTIGAVKLFSWSTLGQHIEINNLCCPCVSMYCLNSKTTYNNMKLQYPFISPYILRTPQKGMMTIWPRWGIKK